MPHSLGKFSWLRRLTSRRTTKTKKNQVQRAAEDVKSMSLPIPTPITKDTTTEVVRNESVPIPPDDDVYTTLDLPKSYKGKMMTEEEIKSEFAKDGRTWEPPEQVESTSWGKTIGDGDRLFRFVDRPMPLRLLNIMPAKSMADDIVCYLRVTTLGAAEPYEALSYTWGDPSHRRFISLNDKRFSVTANLWDALRYLRDAEAIRCVWVDALCINQADVAERNFMVSQMFAIYNNAQRTVAWLGEATHDSDKAINFLAAQLGTESFHSILDDQVVRLEAISEADRELWQALADLCGRAWWTRAWIVQEVGCAREWTIMCGKAHVEGQNLGPIFARMIDAISRLPTSMQEVSFVIQNIRGIGAMQMLRQSALGFHLTRNRTKCAKDPRDKVYAFANMVMPPIEDLYPNYEQPVRELYYQTAVQLIKTSGDLRILSVCELQSQQDLTALTKLDGIIRTEIVGLPSWVPNWTVQRIAAPLWGGYEHFSMPSDKHFHAAGATKPVVNFHGNTLTESHGALTIRGFVVDVVMDLARDYYGERATIGEQVTSASEILSGKRVIQSPTDENTTALLRTLTMDRSSNGQKTFNEIADDLDQIKASIYRATIGRVFYRTRLGFIGLGPRGIKTDDFVIIAFGCHVPLVLRKAIYIDKEVTVPCDTHRELKKCLEKGCAEEIAVMKTNYKIVGEAYVHGAMYGELLEGSGPGDEYITDFTLGGVSGEVVGIEVDSDGAKV